MAVLIELLMPRNQASDVWQQYRQLIYVCFFKMHIIGLSVANQE